jgi:hypothetical protein
MLKQSQTIDDQEFNTLSYVIKDGPHEIQAFVEQAFGNYSDHKDLLSLINDLKTIASECHALVGANLAPSLAVDDMYEVTDEFCEILGEMMLGEMELMAIQVALSRRVPDMQTALLGFRETQDRDIFKGHLRVISQKILNDMDDSDDSDYNPEQDSDATTDDEEEEDEEGDDYDEEEEDADTPMGFVSLLRTIVDAGLITESESHHLRRLFEKEAEEADNESSSPSKEGDMHRRRRNTGVAVITAALTLYASDNDIDTLVQTLKRIAHRMEEEEARIHNNQKEGEEGEETKTTTEEDTS